MTLDGLVTPYLVETLTLERRTGSDAYRGDTFAAPVTVRGRWYDRVQVVRGAEARTVTSTAHATVQEAVAVGDRITDPDGRAREVVAVSTNKNLLGQPASWVAYLA